MNEYLNIIDNDTILNIRQEKTVIDYFNLCAEEYMWEKRGRIPPKVFESWLEGTIHHISKKPIRNLLEAELNSNKKSYYGWMEFIRIKLK